MVTADLSKASVVVIGGANIDLSGQATGRFMLGDSLPGEVRASAGGVGRNIAEALARLSRPTKLITALGDDGFAEDIVRQTAAAGVDLRATLRVPEQRSSTYLTVLDQRGEMVAAINDMELVAAITPAVLEARWRDLEDAAAWVVDANLSEDALAFLFDRQAERLIMAEPVSAAKCARLTPYLSRLSLIKPNLLEARILTGLDEQAAPQTLCAALLDAGVGRVVLSLGQEGLLGQDAGSPALAQAPYPVEIVSVTGAGDTLMAALVDAQLSRWGLAQTLPWAQAAASLSLQSSRAIHPGLSEAAIRAEREAHLL